MEHIIAFGKGIVFVAGLGALGVAALVVIGLWLDPKIGPADGTETEQYDD